MKENRVTSYEPYNFSSNMYYNVINERNTTEFAIQFILSFRKVRRPEVGLFVLSLFYGMTIKSSLAISTIRLS